MTDYAKRRLLTIVSETAIESRLVADIERLGAHGYTVTDARGKGHRGVRSSAWEANSNIRIEVVCDEATADTIAEHLRTHYYADFAMILFISEVAVLRSEKF
ncbi:transcriptional regulator [Halorhodospira abdelmalekii]|uniref:P-II family nitrogen regulator n=1 Tax=Halorhodospira abdelmalekii TaxID=421629 RepID=UPI001904D2F1|nr:transcriptional regulator [Halorhodospira abdelmalekii]MBK1735167.1 transcriptional regulator [Halorhodospira abdelmalekii]